MSRASAMRGIWGERIAVAEATTMARRQVLADLGVPALGIGALINHIWLDVDRSAVYLDHRRRFGTVRRPPRTG